MDIIKKHSVMVTIVLVVLIIGIFAISHDKKNYSLVDFGIPPLAKSDCSSVKDSNNNSPITVSFNVPNVSSLHDQTKALVTKYSGHITSDSFNSYSYPTQSFTNTPQVVAPANISQDSANIVATFDKSQNEFLADLTNIIKSAGGVDASYSYTDGSQPQNGGYSSYTTCVNMMQSVQADVLQLQVFTHALKEERNPANISLLSQSISTVKTTLQTDVNNMNSFFATSDRPSVSISLNTLQK